MTTRLRQVFRPVLPADVSIPSSSTVAPKYRLPRGIPFFRDPAHTVPTKWGLYRPLLRKTASSSSSSFSSIHREIRSRWRETKALTSVPGVKAFLLEYYQLSEYLNSDEAEHQAEVRSLEIKLKEKHTMFDAQHKQKKGRAGNVEKERREKKAKMTGSYHRPTLFNVPLPRMKPQDISVGATIHNRLRARERRIARRREYKSLLMDMKLEVGFWKSLPTPNSDAHKGHSATDEGVELDMDLADWVKTKDTRSPGGWDGIIKDEIKLMDQRFHKENIRSEMQFDAALLGRIGEAKEKKKQWWKAVKKRKKAENSTTTEDG
ncbi:uncharacterized protein I303_100976 [Kwoniella dejecticola CBS 10117]|uniref:Uncharacterized protein n=1 Tax=Kwoniella dejecticola CBS 10117 TaxID=1296121 RepID=A0A1A6AGL7_9TREE|nr:uncharacterized protein I303_00980 [Kwoniella dejecticola CBS 10117]OBR89158.1 hypothetical protein I303_00980 [Kwoniella dejecticola CBS 10117]